MTVAILELKKRGLNHQYQKVGSIEIRNQAGQEADLCFFGDINSESLGEWQRYYPEDKAPSDVQEFLSQLEGVQRINVHINSGGGNVFGGIAIYNLLLRHGAEIIVYVEGLAASIASVIAMAGDRIVIPRNAQMMVHKPSSIAWGNADEMRKEADILDGCQKVILDTYMRHAKAGVTEDMVNALINAETWKNGEEWQEYFDIEVSEGNTAVAAASEYFGKYIHLPENFKEKLQPCGGVVDTEKLANLVADKVLGRIREDTKEEQKAQMKDYLRQAGEILEDLDYCV